MSEENALIHRLKESGVGVGVKERREGESILGWTFTIDVPKEDSAYPEEQLQQFIERAWHATKDVRLWGQADELAERLTDMTDFEWRSTVECDEDSRPKAPAAKTNISGRLTLKVVKQGTLYEFNAHSENIEINCRSQALKRAYEEGLEETRDLCQTEWRSWDQVVTRLGLDDDGVCTIQ